MTTNSHEQNVYRKLIEAMDLLDCTVVTLVSYCKKCGKYHPLSTIVLDYENRKATEIPSIDYIPAPTIVLPGVHE